MSIDDACSKETEEPEENAVETTAAASSVYYTTSSATTYVRSGPGLSYPVVRTLPPHSAVTIYCQQPGGTVTGPYGTTKIWDKIGSGQYVPDCYVYTGSDGYVAPRCN